MVVRVCAALWAAVLSASALAQPRSFTIEEAYRLAEEAHPSVRTAESRLAAGQAELREANAFLWNNPSLSLDGTRRTAPEPAVGDTRFREWSVGLSQPFETGGQPAHRRAAAAAARDALAFAVPDARRRLRAEVSERFYRLLALQARIAFETEAVRISEEASALAQRRLRAGEDSRLDANLARIEAERVRNQAAAAREQLVQARGELAALLGMAVAELPQAEGELEPGAAPAPELLERVAERADLQAAQRAVEAARRRVDLERATRSPDVTIGVNGGREGPGDGRETFTGLTVSLPLPLFRRNDAAIARAAAELTEADGEYRARLGAARAEVAALLEQRALLEERVRRLRAEVIPALDENLALSRRARQAGEIGMTQLLLVSRQIIEARRELLEAQAELRAAHSALTAATTLEPLSNR